MNKNKLLLIFSLLLLTISISAQIETEKLSLIPLPNSIKYESGELKLPTSFSISTFFSNHSSELLSEVLNETLGIQVTTDSPSKSLIQYQKVNNISDEAYRIQIDTTQIVISATSEAGCMNAIYTLAQIFKETSLQYPGQTKRIPALDIEDSPRYQWRSFHIDLARHMFTTDYLKKTIKRLAYYKINKLHLHLNDDQGWRIEIKKHPALTQIGAWRSFDKYDKHCIDRSQYNADMLIDQRFVRQDSIYGGFYTQDEMRNLISYAEKHGVEIIPEIDMPGHMSSAIRAYPWLSCVGNAGWGDEFSFPICPSDSKVLEFAKDIYSEIAELFPSKYIHIGADEVERNTWESCSKCQKLMKQKKMISSEELQSYFVNSITDFLVSKGKKVIAWDDAAISSANNDMYITFWRDWKAESASQIVTKGHPMIFTTWSHFYFSSHPRQDLWKGIYEFDISKDYPHMTESSVIGYQACVWTEEIPTEAKFEQHVFPSLQAFSELIWTKTANRNWNNFLKRMNLHQRMMDKENIRYHVFLPN